MLHRKRTCDCGTEMRKEKHGQYGRWICKKKSKCRKTKGALVGTFFGDYKLSLQQVIQVHFIVFIVVVFYKNIIKIMYFWSRRPVIHINQTELEREIGVSVRSLIDWQNFLRDIAGEFCNQNDRMIGGEGVEVEMDETCVSRRKYNKGRMVKHKQWLVGGVQRNSLGKKCFVEMVADRKRPTLERIIRRRVKPGK